MPPEDLTSSSPASPQDDSSLLTSPVTPPEQAPVFADRIALDQTLEQPSMADRIAVDEEENKRQRLENERKRMKEIDLLSKILPDTKSQTKEMAGIQTQANALIDPKLYTDMTVNWRATAALMGKPLDELDATQYGDYKSQIAVKLNRPAPKSESEYRSMLSEYFVKEKDKDTALNELYGNVVLKAFQDTGMGKNRAMVGLPTDYVKEWEATHKDLIDGDTAYHAQANRVYNQTLKDIESIRGKGAETFSALMDFTQGKADDERIAQVADHLSSSSPEERQKVYRYVGLAAQTGQIDRAGIEQFAINMGQSFSRGFDFVPQGTLQGQEDAFIEMRDTLATGKVWLRTKEGKPTLNDVYRPSQGAVGSAANIDLTGREATPEEVATLKAQAENSLKTFGVIRELRNVAKSEVDPIRPVFEDSAIERGAYGLAGSLGIMVPVAINPMIGTLAYQAQEYDRIMIENPDIDPTFAKGLSLVEGAGNAALDRLQLGAINGKLPVFGGLLNGIKNNGIRRVLTTVGVEVLEQNLQEGAQDLIAPLTETLTAALREDMPDKDFGELMKDYIGSRAETFFAVLPLALLGGGIGTYRDLKNPAMQMADKQLQIAGFGPAQRDYINQAGSLEEKAARIEQEWSKRTETDITAGKELLAASIAEARQSKGGDTIEVNTKADGASEWIVRDPAGKEVARVSTEEEAATIIADRGEAEIRSQANVVADLLDSDWRKDKLPNFEAQFGGEVSPELLLKEAEAKGDKKLVESIKASIEAHGADPANLSKLRILGESWVTPYGEGQYKAFVKLNEGSTAQDAFEELAHNIFDIDLAEGRITKEQAKTWVSQAAAAGVASYKFGTDAEVRESMAQIAQDFAHNRLDQTNLPSSFVAFLKKLYTEFVEFMRRAKLLDQAFAEGKIDAEFERYLMGKVGLSDASMIEREVNRIEGEQGGGQQLDLFQDSRATPEAGADVRTVGDTKIVGPTSFAIRAWHGTPHDVDKFSTEKIGTGEGAQVYGWGLYFAGYRPVAEHYRDALSSNLGGTTVFDSKTGEELAHYQPNKITETPQQEAAWYVSKSTSGSQQRFLDARDSAIKKGASKEVVAVLNEWATSDVTAGTRGEGNLYSVTIDAEEHELLDWDKPLSEQPEATRDILKGMWIKAAKSFPQIDKDANPSVGQIHHLYTQHRGGNQSAVAAEFAAAGIKGIKYLDQGSRDGNGEGTSNYVIFDGKHITITEKNGQPVKLEDFPTDQQTSFSIRARDEAYDAAVKAGDEAEQQRLVDEAALQGIPKPPKGEYVHIVSDGYGGNDHAIRYGNGFALFTGISWNKKTSYSRNRLFRFFQEAIGRENLPPNTYIRVSNNADDYIHIKNGTHHGSKNHGGNVWESEDQLKEQGLSASYAIEFPAKYVYLVKGKDITEGTDSEPVLDLSSVSVASPRYSYNTALKKFPWLEEILPSAAWKKPIYEKTIESNRLVIYSPEGRVIPLSERFPKQETPSISGEGSFGESLDSKASLGSDSDSFQSAPEGDKGSQSESSPDGKNYSIQSQEQIDRVNKAVADTTQFAEGRMALYEKAKVRFKAVLAENKEILDALKEGGAAPEKIRRQKLIQGIAELEVILRQLPAEVRGKVGGFGVLARGGTGDTFLANFFRDRVRMIDDQLEKYLSTEYDEELYRIFERAKPKKNLPGEKPKGIGADIQDLFAKVKEAQRWSAEEVNAHLASIDSRLDSEDLSAEEEARLTREADLIGLVGGWRNKDSNTKAHAIATLKETWAKGYYNFIMKKLREKEQRVDDRLDAIASTGKEGLLAERQEADKKENGWKGKFKKGYFNLISFDQFVSVIFGEKSDIATRLANGERKANSQKEDATQGKMDEIAEFFAGLAGKDKLKGEQLRWQMAQKSLKPFEGTPWSNLEFSEMEAVAATMLWMQEDGKRHMIGKLDDGGRPISAWHYTQEFVDLLESNLSKEAKAFRDFLLKKYDTEYDSINKVYKALNGINLPKIENYSPVTVAPVNAPAGTAIDPVTGGVMAARGTSPGALRTRGQAIAEPKFQDALQTYIAHTKQMEHWKAYAPFMADANGILRNRDVQNAIEAKGGKEAKAVLNTWTDLFSQGGVRSAEAQLGLSKDISEAGGRAARVALVGRIGTILIQSTQLGAALAEMPTGAYILRMSKLLSGNLGWKAAFESDYIQRRLNEMPPIVRQAVEGLKSDRPNVVKSAVEKLGRMISGADAIFTAGTYAITYDYHLKQAKQMGIPSPEAYAKSVAERAVDKLAQPTRMGARSVIENTSTGLIRNFWAFASESRKNLGLAAYALHAKDPARIGRTLISLVVLNSLLGNIIRNAWSDARDDDDDEWFDEKHWGLKRMLTSTAVDSLQVRGIPVLGDAISTGFYDAVNQYHHTGSLISFGGFIRAMKHIPKYVEGDADWEMTFKDIDGILSVGGLFNESIAAAASLSHLANDAFGVAKNTKKAATGE